MKILIAYHSHSGGTEKLAKSLAEEFAARGHLVEAERIFAAKKHNALFWFLARIFKDDCEIIPPKIKDVASYDIVCFGSPNWTKVSLPMAGYIKSLTGLSYKKIGFFSTTALPPPLEWYIFSAYFLEESFNRLIKAKNARPVAFLLLSSIFKRWAVGSLRAEELSERFCRELESPIASYKEHFLSQAEAEESRFLLVLFLSLAPVSLFLWLRFFGETRIFSLGGRFYSSVYFAYFFFSHFLLCYLLSLTSRYKQWLSRYLVVLFLEIWWTIAVFASGPLLAGFSSFGYIIVIIFSGFFRQPKTVVFSGFAAAICFSAIRFASGYGILDNYFFAGAAFIIICSLLELLIASSARNHFLKILEIQDEIELSNATLEERVKLKTKELVEFAAELDEQVKKRTEELQEKVAALERFNRLAIGRELKMISLKEELEKLKSQSQKPLDKQ